MTVKLTFQGGPYDGSEQLVQAPPGPDGSVATITVASYQTFDPSGNVIDVGITGLYQWISDGPADPGGMWSESQVWEYVGVPVGVIPPPVPTRVLLSGWSMGSSQSRGHFPPFISMAGQSLGTSVARGVMAPPVVPVALAGRSLGSTEARGTLTSHP